MGITLQFYSRENPYIHKHNIYDVAQRSAHPDENLTDILNIMRMPKIYESRMRVRGISKLGVWL